MADKKLVEQITPMGEDFAQWYTDVVKKAELTDYSSVKGFMVIRPAGYAIWENIMHELDQRFKASGVENVAMPMLPPSEGEGPRRGLRTRGCLGNRGWTEEARGASLCTPDLRDTVL